MEILASIKEFWTRLTCGVRPCVFCEIASGVRKEEILYQVRGIFFVGYRCSFCLL